MYRTEEAYETYLPPKMIFKVLLNSDGFAHLSPSLIKLSTSKIPWNKTVKTPTFTGITPHVTILNVLVAISTSQDGTLDEVLGNFVADLRKRGIVGGFSEERMHSFLEVIWNKLEYALKD